MLHWIKIVFLVYLGIVIMFSVFENSLVYFPAKQVPTDWTLNDGMEDAWFETSDGVKLHGWFQEVESPRAVVLFFNGNGGNIGWRRDRLDDMRQLQVSVLLWSYPGYGLSEGRPNEKSILEAARLARQWLAERTKLEPADIVLWGESLGGGVAVDLAQEGARGLILENTFSSMPDVASYHYPWLPVRTLMRNRYDSVSKISQYRGPLLQFHGNRDSIVPYALGQRLFNAANEPKKWVTLEGADHNDPRSPLILEEVDKFIDRLPFNKNSPFFEK